MPDSNNAQEDSLNKGTIAPSVNPDAYTRPFVTPPLTTEAKPLPSIHTDTTIQNQTIPNAIPPHFTQPHVTQENSPESQDSDSIYGKILSSSYSDILPWPVLLISTQFFIITFIYVTMTFLLIGTLIALSIALANIGSPGFIYLKYYPHVSLLPIMTGLFGTLFYYIAFKIREQSRFSWLLGTLCLAIIPIVTAMFMPALAYPLVKLVSVYAGSPVKPLLSPSITVKSLSNYISVILLLEAGLLLLLVTIRKFSQPARRLADTAKTALFVTMTILLLPSISLIAYGFYDTSTTDYDFVKAENIAGFILYRPRSVTGGRVISSNYIPYESLGGKYNAVKVTYNAPLPAVIQSGLSSPVTITQVDTYARFNLYEYVRTQPLMPNTVITPVRIANAVNNEAYQTFTNGYQHVWFVLPDSIFVDIASPVATLEELVEAAESLTQDDID